MNNDEVEKKWTTEYRNDIITYILDQVEPLGAEIIYDGDTHLVSSTWKTLDKSKRIYSKPLRLTETQSKIYSHNHHQAINYDGEEAHRLQK